MATTHGFDDPLLVDYQEDLELLAASCSPRGSELLGQIVEILIAQILRGRGFVRLNRQLVSELGEAREELASINAVLGTSHKLVVLPASELQADPEDIDALPLFEALRAEILSDSDEANEAVDEVKRVFKGKAKACARSRDQANRRQTALAEMDSFRRQLG